MGEFEKRIDAAKRGRVAKVRAIILGHAELINQRDQTGATALHYAAFGGHRGVVQALVEQGAQMNAADGNSVRPLPGGRSNTCARWVDSWRLNWKTLPTRYGEVTSNETGDPIGAILSGYQSYAERVVRSPATWFRLVRLGT